MRMLLTIAIFLLSLAACWFMYQILVQQGRLQIRLESLEREIRQLGIGPQPGPIGSQGGLPRNSVLPDFSLRLLNGGITTLSAYRGRKVLLIFFNPSCCYSMRLAPDLQRIKSPRLTQNPVPVIISTGDSLHNRRLFGNLPIASMVLLQEGCEMATLYRVKGTPMGYLIDEEGRTESGLLMGPEILRLMLARHT
jgi:peroxiredoxin